MKELSPPSSLKSGYLRVKGAAEYLGTTEKAVRHLIDRGYLKPYRLAGRLYLSREEIDRAMRESEVSNGYFEYVDDDGHECLGVRVVMKSRHRPGMRIQRERRLGPVNLKRAKISERILRDEAKRELVAIGSMGPTWRELLDRYRSALMADPTRISPASETTLHDYEVTLRKYTSGWLNRPAISLATNDVVVLLREFDRLKLSQSRKKHARTAINLVFDWAGRERLLPPSVVSPGRGISIGKKLKNRQPILTLSQIRRFLDEAAAIGHEFYELWAVAFLTGMRSGELHELRWSDVCYERNLIRVERSYNKRQNIVKSTKSGDWREVPMNQELQALLERLRLKTGATGHVLPRINSWRRGEASKVTRSFLPGDQRAGD